MPCGDITAICLKGEFGHYAIFNIYNDCSNNNLTTVLKNFLNTHSQEILPSPNNHMYWFGDFNRHHPLWETDDNNHLFNLADMINPLLVLITEYNMAVTLPHEILTYEMTTSNWT